MTDLAHPRFIVVGVDGSEGSKKALGWAADQAALTHATLRVVTAWHVHVGFGFPPMLPVSYEEPARRELEATTLAVLGHSPACLVEAELKQGHPRQVLVDASIDADLLVVGSRGLGGFAGMLLGSVSEYCASHAKCTVVIVR
jgi:nucleotide-binding universal stress UspA family protein